jgi:soluble lytic murein transglycosylase-like protein
MRKLAAKLGFHHPCLSGGAGLALGLLIFGLWPRAAAQAEELLCLKNGKTLLIQSHLISGERITLFINPTSQMEIATDWVEKIEPYVIPPVPPNPTQESSKHKPPANLDPKQLKNLIEKTAKKYQLDAGLLNAMIQAESNFNPRAVSTKGALGLMQLMPETAALMKVANVWDAAENINGGAKYLKELMALFHQDLGMALAAYNAGPTAVTFYNGIPPYPETQQYIRRVLSLMRPR